MNKHQWCFRGPMHRVLETFCTANHTRLLIEPSCVPGQGAELHPPCQCQGSWDVFSPMVEPVGRKQLLRSRAEVQLFGRMRMIRMSSFFKAFQCLGDSSCFKLSPMLQLFISGSKRSSGQRDRLPVDLGHFRELISWWNRMTSPRREPNIFVCRTRSLCAKAPRTQTFVASIGLFRPKEYGFGAKMCVLHVSGLGKSNHLHPRIIYVVTYCFWSSQQLLCFKVAKKSSNLNCPLTKEVLKPNPFCQRFHQVVTPKTQKWSPQVDSRYARSHLHAPCSGQWSSRCPLYSEGSDSPLPPVVQKKIHDIQGSPGLIIHVEHIQKIIGLEDDKCIKYKD